MHIVITGDQGRLGGKLAAMLAPDHTITGVDLPDWNLADPASVDRLAALAPDLVIHCAAWTDVDGCARDPEKALRVNAFGTKHVALACQQTGAALAHISTNEIFDGQQTHPYLEYDRANPINPYGYSKWVAEQIVQELVPRHYIIRPSWLIAHGGRNFVQAILGRASAGQSLRVVIDEIAAPTYNDDLAAAIVALIQTGHYGCYHLVNEGHASRWELARFVLDHTGYADTPIDRIVLAQYPRPSTAPPRAVLRNMAAAHLGITLRPWQEAVRAFLRQEGLLVE
jgi:dTDP-4-dehydrorhamnose reductase